MEEIINETAGNFIHDIIDEELILGFRKEEGINLVNFEEKYTTFNNILSFVVNKNGARS